MTMVFKRRDGNVVNKHVVNKHSIGLNILEAPRKLLVTSSRAEVPYVEVYSCHVWIHLCPVRMSYHTSKNNIIASDIAQMSHEDARCKSFRFFVSESMLDKVLDPSVWPENCFVKRFYERRNNGKIQAAGAKL